MLTTSNSYSNTFLEYKRLFLDSTILIDWAARPSVDAAFEEVQREYSLILCSASLLEVGFGAPGKAAAREVERVKSLYDLGLRNVVDFLALHNLELNNRRTPQMCVYNPTAHEWYASRTSLLALVAERKLSIKAVRILTLDAIVYTCAWNARAAIVTDNIRDFMKFNEIQKTLPSGVPRHLPIFTIADILSALNSEVSYPENLAGRA
jgi:predicted nucleic acid-binding protein